MHNNRNKFIVSALGVIFCLILLEIFLRFIGFIHSHKILRDKMIRKEKNSYIILCLGDSFTFGDGAPKDKSFPKQLEKLFNKNVGAVNVKVINRGDSGFNTFMISNKFDEYLREVNPDLIILLAGGCNLWNSYGYRNYLNKGNLLNKLHDYLYDIKVFKLVILLSSDIKNKALNLFEQPIWPKFRFILSELPSEVREWLNKGYDCERKGKYNEAISWYKNIITKIPNSAFSYNDISRIYSKLGNIDEAKQYLKKAIELDPARAPLAVVNGIHDFKCFFDHLRVILF